MFCETLKARVKDYFNSNKIEGVFIAVGILTYRPEHHSSLEKQAAADLNIRELYIGAEMRRFKRINYHSSVEVVLQDKRVVECRSFDLSQKGVGLVSPEPMKMDEKIKIRMKVQNKNIYMNALGRVMWVQPLDGQKSGMEGKCKIGVAITEIPDKDRKILNKELKLYY